MGRPKRTRNPGFFGGEPRSASSQTAVPLYRFLHPRYARVWLMLGWLRLSALLPFRFTLAIHKRLGRWLGRRSKRSTETVLDNLERCFPELTPTDRDALASDYFANMGAIVAELGMAWFGSPAKLKSLFDVQGVANLEQALARNKGVILCAGHFTPIEICSVAIHDHAPHYTLMYNSRRSRLLSEIQRRSRERHSDASVEKHNLRELLRGLGRNSVVWFSGDEAHTGKSAAMLPFFGTPALTNTALSRLARISEAAIVPLAYCRKADDSGYRIRFEPALENFPSDDEVTDTKRLIEILEAQIRECPAQYFWKQQRFRARRGEGTPARTMIGQ